MAFSKDKSPDRGLVSSNRPSEKALRRPQAHVQATRDSERPRNPMPVRECLLGVQNLVAAEVIYVGGAFWMALQFVNDLEPVRLPARSNRARKAKERVKTSKEISKTI